MTPDLSDVIRPGRSRGLDYVNLDELRKRTGIQTREVLKWAINEMLCNSLDTDATEITIKARTVGDFDEVTVSDNGSTRITLEDVKLILDFSNKASSKRGLLQVSRGAHGNALKSLFGYGYVLAEEAELTPPEAHVSSHGETFGIRISPNRVSQEIEHEITVEQTPQTECNAFTFRFPVDRIMLRTVTGQETGEPTLEAQRLYDHILATAMVNPERRIIYDLWGIHVGTFGEPCEAGSLRKDTSALWYEPDEFTELLYDYARARPETQLKEFISLFRGFTAKKIQREILHSLRDSPNHDSQTSENVQFFPGTPVRDLSPSEAERLYGILRSMAKAVTKRSTSKTLGCVGKERFEAVKEREGWTGMKYDMKEDRVEPLKGRSGEPLSHASYPFLIELAVFDRAPDDAEGPKVYSCVNFMASDDALFSRLFNVEQRLGQVGITPETPVTVVVHLVCPVLKWLNYAKTAVGGEHVGKLLKKLFDRLLPVPKQPRRYKLKTPKKPASWFPRGDLSREEYRRNLKPFAETMAYLDSRRGTILSKVSARGWGYIMEGMGNIHKGEFKAFGNTLNDCIKLGYLPIDFTAADQDPTRRFSGIHMASNPADLLRGLRNNMDEALYALPHHMTEYWKDEEYYLMMYVEKIDIFNLFEPVCKEYNIPIANSGGWYTLKPRYEIAELSRRAEARGQKPVLLLFFDHDVTGMAISQMIRGGLREMMGATGWDPRGLVIDRFGLNLEDIEEHGLMWIHNLKSGSGRDPDLRRRDVMEYVSRYGYRKCEANALLKDEESLRTGLKLSRDAIEKYYGSDAFARFGRKREATKEVLKEIYENPVWAEVHRALSKLIDGYCEENGDELAPPEAEKEYSVNIYERIDEEHYQFGRCPVCSTLFDYDRSILGRTVRCRTCNAPMRLIDDVEGEYDG
ncbi:hypothetical protein ISS39_10665 [Candidatus Bathyarchaeota archaeon]|nr:hypothetical protein [Candidatus Bathyarchaeota archaeon]